MYLSYKLNDGTHAKLFNHDLLLAEKKKWEKHYRKSTEVRITDENDKDTGIEFSTDILKEKYSGRFYVKIGQQKIYISDFEYLDVEEIVNKLANNENVSFDIFVSSLIKNPDRFAFIEQRMVPDTVISGLFRSYSGNNESKKVVCIPTEKCYEKEKWSYKIETIPVEREEKEIYGSECFYMIDYYNRVLNGYISVISIDDIKNYNFGDKQSLALRRERKK